MDESSANYPKTSKNLESFFNHVSNTGGTLFINGDLFDFYFEYLNSVMPGIKASTGKSKKALILDCDNTLWHGRLGEDGPDGPAGTDPRFRIRHDPDPRARQR